MTKSIIKKIPKVNLDFSAGAVLQTPPLMID